MATSRNAPRERPDEIDLDGFRESHLFLPDLTTLLLRSDEDMREGIDVLSRRGDLGVCAV